MTNVINKQETEDQLEEHGINVERIQSLWKRLKEGDISHSSFVIDSERIRPPEEKHYRHYENISITIDEARLEKLNKEYSLSLVNPLTSESLKSLGLAAIRSGDLGCLWLNGGAATRYFNEKKVKPEEKERFKKDLSELTEAKKNLPKGVTPALKNTSYLELKVRNLLHTEKLAETKRPIPVILMNSFITNKETANHFDELYKKYSELKPSQFHKIIQGRMPRWTQPENMQNIDLFATQDGKLSFAPGGHGNFLELLKNFFDNNNLGIKYLFFANIDNFGASIDPVILGIHIAEGKGRTVELAPKKPGDKGGAPAFVDDKLVIVEQMKFPDDFDQDQISAFNSNSFWFTINDLLNYTDELPYVLAEKNVNGADVLQLEQIAADVNLPTTFLIAPRKLRFWPTKRYIDLLIFRDPHPRSEEERTQHELFKNLLKEQYDTEIP